MSCHYSCLTCSGSIYADLCLTCPSTRQLIDTTCLCLSGLYEYQNQDCLTYDQITRTDYSFFVMLNILYYIMLGFSWLLILANLNHLYSSKIRCMVTFCQLTSLLLDYRYRFTSLTQKALNIFGVWNFRYFDSLFCSQLKSKPYQCQSYQNLYGPLFTLAAFIICLFISYIMTKTCIFSLVTESQETPSQQQLGGDMVIIDRGRQQYRHFSNSNNNSSSIKSMTFIQYIKISFKSFLFMYIDYSVIQWTVQLSRIAYLQNYLGYGMYAVLILLTIIFVLYFLSLINSQNQFNVEYRSRMGYLYIFDKNYYLNYLDYLYAEQRAQRQFQSNKYKDQSYTPQRYYPQSNYIILQIVMKFFISSTTIIMFQYKPQLWVVPSLIVMMVAFTKLGVFLVYERLALLIFYIGFVVYFICVLVFWVDQFFNVWVIILALIATFSFFILMVSDMSDWTREKQGRYWQVAFEYLDQDVVQQGDDKDFHLRSQQHEHLENNYPNQREQSFNDLMKVRSNEELNQKAIVSSKKQPMQGNEGLGQTNKSIGSKKQLQGSNPGIVTKTIFGNTKLSFKKNLNPSQKHSMLNLNNDSFNIHTKSNLSQRNVNKPIIPQINQNESFMSRTNRVRFAHLEQQNPMNYNGSLNRSNSRFSNSLQRSNGLQGSNLPQIEEDKQESVDERESQVRVNQGQRLSETSLIRPQNNRLNDSFGSKIINSNNQSSRLFNKTPNKESYNNQSNIFQGQRQSKR